MVSVRVVCLVVAAMRTAGCGRLGYDPLADEPLADEPVAEDAAAAAFPDLDGWQYARRLQLDVASVDGELRDFPVLVRLHPARIDYDHAQPAGQDVRFVSAD